jgi:parallel beta-helix repeat protein
MNLQGAFTVLLLFISSAVAPQMAGAAQSYDNCNGFIDSLPTMVSTQGVWCLRHDLATNIVSGKAIEIAANNVTIDCNDFKIGGLSAGNGSQAYGIFASGRQNAAIRHCNVRGFYIGIHLGGGAGHLVEDNRLDNNLSQGISVVSATHSVVRGNRVFDTGGSTVGNGDAGGIYATADIIDNTVDGVFTAGNTNFVEGIIAGTNSMLVSGNRIRGLALTGGVGTAYGIRLLGSGPVTVSHNRIVAGDVVLNGTGIKGADVTFCTYNIVSRYSIPWESILVQTPVNTNMYD